MIELMHLTNELWIWRKHKMMVHYFVRIQKRNCELKRFKELWKSMIGQNYSEIGKTKKNIKIEANTRRN